METTVLERVRASLLEKRSALSDWLSASPDEEKSVLLGPSDQAAVLDHLGVIDEAIAQTEAGTLGLCTVCGEPVEQDLLEMDYTASVCIEHLSRAEIARLENELELAKAVQKALLPQEVPSIPDLDMAAYSRPAEFLGGDYFDFITFGPGAHGLLIADVSGHGVSASLQMASLQALARAIIPTGRSPAEVTGHIHGLFRHNVRFTTFVSLFVGAFHPATGTLTYCNAGHNPPLVLHRDHDQNASVSWLYPTGPAIGLVEGAEFDERAVTLHPGDLLILYTDGLVEATDPDMNMFGKDRLAGVVGQYSSASSREVVLGIRHSLEAFVAGQPLSDDVTLVVCRIT